jgi:guanine deaminase
VTDIDTKFLLQAVALAGEHMHLGHGGPFGAVIVMDGRVIGEGWNQVTSSNDPTAHAEMVAIRRATQALGAFSLAKATIYSSCEPCPMCLAAIYWARLERLVFASTRTEAAAIGFDDDLIYQEIAKPPVARQLPSTHLPLVEARAVFTDWQQKTNRLNY